MPRKLNTRDGKRGGAAQSPAWRALRTFCLGALYLLRWAFTPNLRVLKIEKYVFGEVWGWFLLGVMGFTFFMVITTLFILGEKIFSKHIPIYTTLKILILSAPSILVLAVPVAMLFATLMAMGRLSRDNEITMFVSSGVSLYSIFLPFICLGLYSAILSWSIYEYLVPVNNKKFVEILAVFWDSQVVDFIKPNVVIKAPGDKYFYIESVDRDADMMYNLRLYDYADQRRTGLRPSPRIFIADRAWVKNKFLHLDNVRIIETDSKGDVIASDVAEHTTLDISRKLSIRDYESAPQELSTAELRERIVKRGTLIARYEKPSRSLLQLYWTDYTEYYFKFSIPFSSLVFVLVAVPLSLRGPRDERNLGMIQTFSLVMVYYALYFTFQMLGSLGRVAPMLAGWIPTVFFALASIFLIIKARK